AIAIVGGREMLHWRAMSSSDALPSVLGELVLAWGDGADAFVARLDGYTRISEPGEPAQAAVRGAARHGTSAGGTRWMAVARLVSAELAAGAGALSAAAPPPPP